MFDQSMLDFLGALSAGKGKAWFGANRSVNEGSLINPLRRLVSSVGEWLVKLDPTFELR